MYQNEKFSKFATLPAGEIKMLLPGTTMTFPYKSGSGFINAAGNVGYAALGTYDLLAVADGEATGVLGALGEQLRDGLKNPATLAQIRRILTAGKTFLFASKTSDKTVLTLPGFNADPLVDDESIADLVVCSYAMGHEQPSVEEVYGYHANLATDGRKLVSDQKELQELVLALPAKSNETYVAALNLMKDSLFG